MRGLKDGLRRLPSSQLLKHNLVFFIGTLAISFFNYLYYPVLSRIVSVSEFGEIQAVISLFMQLGIVLTAFGYVITNIVSNARNHKESNELVRMLEQMMLIVGGVLFVLLWWSSYSFKANFKFDSVVPILLVGLLIIVNIPSTSRAYILQGMKRLKDVSIAGIIFAAGKLIVSVGLIYVLTDSVSAAVAGYLIAQVLMLAYVRHRLGGMYGSAKNASGRIRLHRLSARQKRMIFTEVVYGIVIAVVLAGLALLYSSDTILARLFFEPHELGIYSGVSSVARIIFFVTASVAGVLIAMVRLDHHPHDNHKIFIRSVALVCAIGGVGVLAFALLPNLFVRLLVGVQYVEGAKWLPLLSFSMFICSLNNLIAIYLLALRRYIAIVPVAIGVVFMTIGLLLKHESITEFIWVLLTANLIVGVLLTVGIVFAQRKGAMDVQGATISSTAQL